MTGTVDPLNKHPIGADGIWAEVRNPGIAKGATPLFLDRDGVMVEEVNYLHKPKDMRLEADAAAVIRAANDAGLAVVIVTNQAGIGYGKYGWDDFAAVQACMLSELEGLGARIDAVYACPFHKTGNEPWRHPNHPARKPNPGMLTAAIRDLSLAPHLGWIVGDRANDLEAGKRAGLQGGLHVATGHGTDPGERDKAMALKDDQFDVRSGGSIADAMTLPVLTG